MRSLAAGVIEAQEIAERIVRRNLIPDLILVSPAERAWSTAEILASACELDTKCSCNAPASSISRAPETTRRLLARRDSLLPPHSHLRTQSGRLSQVREPAGPHPDAGAT